MSEVRSKKEIRYWHDGIVEELDMPEFQARGLHTFENWMCSIGINTLHVNHEGRVFYGTCREGGLVGFVDKPNEWKPRPKQWRKCTREWCHCGCEIKQNKVAPDGKHIVSPSTYDNYVVWDLSRYCNFDCSYCPEQVHNATDGHHSLDWLLGVVDRIEQYFDGEKGIQFSLSGGEPTFDPNIIKLCRYIRARGHHVHVQSNGSRGKKFWEEFVPHVTSLTVSIHFEFMNEDRLFRNIGYILDNLRDDSILEVKMIAQEENLERVTGIRDRLLANPTFVKKARLAVMPVSDFEEPEKGKTAKRKPRTYEQVVEFKYT